MGEAPSKTLVKADFVLNSVKVIDQNDYFICGHILSLIHI